MAKSDQPGVKGAGKRKGSKSGRQVGGPARRTGKAGPASSREVSAPEPTLAQVLEQQKAASEILHAIASAPADLDSILRAVAFNAARLCGADDAQIYRLEGDQLLLAASHGPIPTKLKEASLNRGWVTGRSIIDRQTIHVPDLAAESEEEYPIAKAMQREHGHHTTLATPLLTPSGALGSILIRRWEVNPFTDAQIGLLETFASQAVVAIENARIVSELETRNKELDDALEQQNAMAELLRAISSANGELKPVFETLLRNAIRLCEAEFGLLFLKEGEEFTAIAMLGLTEAFRKHMEGRRYRFGRGTATGRAVLAGKPVQIVDLKAETGSEDAEARKSTVELGGGRTIFSVPMMQESRAIGAITIYRREVRPFSEKQIELVSSFANHAVIAVENARLLNDLQDSLRQQTATADVLKTISSTAFDLDAVLSTLLQSALELCGAFAGSFLIREGDAFVDVIQIGWPEGFSEFVRGRSSRPGTGSVGQRVALTGEIVHAHDVLNDPDYEYKDAQRLGGYRTMLGAPLIRDGEVIGILMLARDEVRPFADNEIRLVQTFCDQAVIAFQNSRLLQELQDRNDDLSEALDQQTATAEILRAISTSPTDTQPVFDAIARHAATLCRGQFCNVFRFDGELVHFVAHHGSDQKAEEIVSRAFPDTPGMGSAAQRSILKQEIVQIPDIASDPDYRRIDIADYTKFQSVIGVPMMRGDQPIGAITVMRSEAGTFPDRHIELLRTFAEQAVIAIENVRLFTELDARNRALAETLEQQKATSEILRAISTSPTDTQPVFDAIARHAATLCNAQFCFVFRFDGEQLHFVAHHGVDQKGVAIVERAFPAPPNRDSAAQRSILERAIAPIEDVQSDTDYARNDISQHVHYRSIIAVPMMREGQAIGTISLARAEVGAFPQRQVDLLQTFAEQAVIAIENVRLFTELNARNRDLAETLEQQKATSEILSVISSSPTDAQPVFDTIVRNAVSLCDCLFANVFRYDGEQLHYLASHNIQPGYRDMLDEKYPMRPDRTQVSGRTILAGTIVHLEDALADPLYDQRWPEAAGWRSMLGVPMMRDGVPIGALVLGWGEPGPIAEAQVKLIQTFADQAVIAIENVRLFTELNARNRDLRKTLDRQTATAEVLKTISRSTFDLETVLQALAESAVRLCTADHGTIVMKKDGIFYRAVNYGLSPEFAKVLQDQPVEIQRGSAAGRALLNGEIVHIHDVELDPDYTFLEAKTVGGLRTVLAVPMLREGEAIGVFAVTRNEVEPFTDEQIELISTFADQAAIAIENVRLYESVEARSQELARSLEELRNMQDRLVQTEKLASLGQLTAGIAHEIKNPLNFVNNFASVSVELLDELLEDLRSVSVDGDGKAAIDELAEMLSGNLAKIAEHGQRADSIVKNMLMHARQGSSEHRLVEINALVDESLNLAYHGARAEKQGFTIEIGRDFDPAVGEADIYPQEITRVLLNLISNGFYAASKKSEKLDGFEPRLTVSTRGVGDRVEIRVRDNGPGMDRETRNKLFSPFFTTKPVGEGTGLGLSISHDIIVKQHGGIIDVDSVPGEYCEFRIEIPRDAAGRTTGAAK